MKLAINADGMLFAYYRFVRSMYGVKTDADQRTSLCPFFQTMLWGSLFCVIFSPFILTGWIAMKVMGGFFKLQGERTDRFINWMEEQTPIPKAMEKAPDAFANSPILIGLFFTIGLLVALGGTAAGLTCLAAGFWYGAWYFDDIFAWCAHGFATIFWGFGWGMFWFFHLLGAGLYWAQYWIVWLFTNGPLWSFIGYWAAWIGGSVAVVGSACMLIVYMAMLVLRSRPAKWMGRFLLGKFNGLKEAAEARQRRLANLRKENEIKAAGRKGVGEWVCPYCEYNNQGRLKCMNCERERPAPEQKPSATLAVLVSLLNATGRCFAGMWGQVAKFGGEGVQVLGGLGIVWQYIKAIKSGVCPMIEFTTPGSLQDRAKLAAIDLEMQQAEKGPEE